MEGRTASVRGDVDLCMYMYVNILVGSICTVSMANCEEEVSMSLET